MVLNKSFDKLSLRESGKVEHGSIPASADRTMTTFNRSDVDIEFTNSYSSSPTVITSLEVGGRNVFDFIDVSETGFTSSVLNYDDESRIAVLHYAVLEDN